MAENRKCECGRSATHRYEQPRPPTTKGGGVAYVRTAACARCSDRWAWGRLADGALRIEVWAAS